MYVVLSGHAQYVAVLYVAVLYVVVLGVLRLCVMDELRCVMVYVY